ncbi:MAG: POTRA domain-containing protein, partial [Candidatus Acidiferrum sp.]
MKAKDRAPAPLIRRAAVLLGAVLCLPSSIQGQQSAPASKVLIADVIIQGNRIIATQDIQSQLKTRVGLEYIAETVQEDVRNLYATRKFINIQVRVQDETDGRKTVYFLVREYPSKVEKITYQGIRHLKDADLELITGIRAGGSCNPVANKIACQAIVKKLNEQGRPYASCDLLKGALPGDTEVIFNIN